MASLPFQLSLFDGLSLPDGARFDASFRALARIDLDDTASIEHVPGWVRGADLLFAQILAGSSWGQRTRWMYEARVLEPRLTALWHLASGEALAPPVVDDMRRCLIDRYGVSFDSVGFNLYRDGKDSVAWHGDKIRKEIAEPIVALVALGEPRKLLFRRRGGGPSRAFLLGHGDLLVTCGRTQRTWEHCVPKVARAGPRISIAFRYGMDLRAYARRARRSATGPSNATE